MAPPHPETPATRGTGIPVSHKPQRDPSVPFTVVYITGQGRQTDIPAPAHH